MGQPAGPIRSAGFAPSVDDIGKGLRTVDKAVTAMGTTAVETLRRSVAGSGNDRHYGPRLREYGVPGEVDPNKNLYNQVDDYGMAARDVANRATVRGGDSSGQMAIEELGRARSRRRARVAERDEVLNIEADRRNVIDAQGKAGQALADAIRQRDEFFGERGGHRAFKTDKARRKEFARLQRRAEELAQAAEGPMAMRAPKVPDMPPELPDNREQRLLQEMQRADREGVKFDRRLQDQLAEASGNLPVVDPITREMTNTPRPTGGYAPIPTRAKFRKGRTKREGLKQGLRIVRPEGVGASAAIDDRASDLLMNPTKADEGARIARDYGDGFRPSRTVGRVAGYGAVAAGIGGAYGINALAANEREGWKKDIEEIDDFAPGFGEDDRTPAPEIAGMSWHQIQAVQKDLNFAIGTDLDPDGRFGDLTAKAVLEFERREGLPQTGNPRSPETKKRLLQYQERRIFAEERRYQEEDAKRLDRLRLETAQ